MESSEIIDKVMEKVQEFYMGDDNDSAEEILQKFAAQHADKFGQDFLESDDFENKLEYTLVYQEY